MFSSGCPDLVYWRDSDLVSKSAKDIVSVRVWLNVAERCRRQYSCTSTEKSNVHEFIIGVYYGGVLRWSDRHASGREPADGR